MCNLLGQYIVNMLYEVTIPEPFIFFCVTYNCVSCDCDIVLHCVTVCNSYV